MQDPDEDLEEGIEDLSDEMFNISDVKFYSSLSKNRRQVTLLVKAENDFNLMKIYFSLKWYVEEMEKEIGIMEGPPEFQ